MRRLSLALCTLGFWLSACSRHAETFRPHADVPEMSGVVESRRYPGVYWAHGDSANAPELYAIDVRGRSLARFDVDADNKDWEDIARDDDGHLYIGDIGNNLHARKDLVVYVIDEPDPKAKQGIVAVRARLPFRYPDQKQFPDLRMRFDAEALFFAKGRLYLLTKHWRDTRSTLYRFVRLENGPEQTLERLSEIDLRVDPGERTALVTAADLSPDGGEVAVLTYLRVYRFAFTETGLHERLWWRDFHIHKGAEAIAWDNAGFLIGHEDGYLQRIRRIHH